jgi:hypothetical protein
MDGRSPLRHARAVVALRKRREREEHEKSQDDNLADLIKSTNEDVSDTRNELFAFVAALAFVVVTIYTITVRDLLALAPVKLPFIGLSVPLNAFFVWTPPVVIAIHIVILLRLARLREKLAAIDGAVPEGAMGESHRLRVVSNFFAQMIVDRPKARGRRWLLWFVFVSAVLLAPFLTLLLLIVRALPLHDVSLTLWQNAALSVDLGVAAYLTARRWPKVSALFWLCISAIVANLLLCVPDGGFDVGSGRRRSSRPNRDHNARRFGRRHSFSKAKWTI